MRHLREKRGFGELPATVVGIMVDLIPNNNASRVFRKHDATRAVPPRPRLSGCGAYSLGRARHSIDQRQLHGPDPNLDAIESRDDRLLLSGTACSVEPGIYTAGVCGLRSEVSLYVGDRDILVTPRDYQRELIIL